MKICRSCRKRRRESSFAWKDKARGIRQSSCKDCHKKYSRNHYLSNKGYYAAKAHVSRQKNKAQNRKIIVNYLKLHPCADCGESDIVTLDFDHNQDKSFNIGQRYSQVTPAKLLTEIAKCTIRCANCHRRKTAKAAGNWYKTAV